MQNTENQSFEAEKLPVPPGDKWNARAVILAGVIVLGVIGVGSCSAEPSSSSGAPATSAYRAAAEEIVRQKLRDPGSAEFTSVRVLPAAAGKPTIVCGTVNARNGFGGMTGPQRFIVGGTTALEEEVGKADMDQLTARFC